jgi:hypothetical protein
VGKPDINAAFDCSGSILSPAYVYSLCLVRVVFNLRSFDLVPGTKVYLAFRGIDGRFYFSGSDSSEVL